MSYNQYQANEEDFTIKMILSSLITHCRHLLLNSEGAQQAQAYLNARLSPRAQERFGFGHFPPQEGVKELVSIVGERELSDEELVWVKHIQNGIFNEEQLHGSLEKHNLVMPYKNSYGEVIGIVGRSLLSDVERKEKKIPKYKNTSFPKRENLFGLYEAKKAIVDNDYVIVVEGQFDMISAYDKGLKNVVAVGNHTLTMEQVCLLLRYTNNIVMMFDMDEPGQEGGDRAVKEFGKYCNIRKGKLPGGYKDVCEFLGENGAEELRYAIK